MKRLCALAGLCAGVLLSAGTVQANTIESSTMYFQGSLTQVDLGGGVYAYTGTIAMTKGYYYVPGGPGTVWDPVDSRWETPDGREAVGGFDVYALAGGTAYVQGKSPPSWTIGSDHDAYFSGGPWGTWYDPDVPDWVNYELELTTTGWRVEAFGGDDDGDGFDETPFLGSINWSSMIAYESGSNWNPTWSWGVEDIPLQTNSFIVSIADLGGGRYHVTLTPTPEPASLLLLGGALAGGLGLHRGRRRGEKK